MDAQHSWLHPSTAFSIACVAFSVLALTTVWKKQQSPSVNECKDDAVHRTSQTRPQPPLRVAGGSQSASDLTPYMRPSQSPALVLQQLLQHVTRISRNLRASQQFQECRLVLTSLLGELSLLTTTISRLQRSIRPGASKATRNFGQDASFEFTICSVTEILHLLEAELKQPSASSIIFHEALQQLRNQRPSLEFLLDDFAAESMPPTPPSEAITTESLNQNGVSSMPPLPSFNPTAFSSGADGRSWIEPPPEYAPPADGSVFGPEKEGKQYAERAPPGLQHETKGDHDTDALYNAVANGEIDLMSDLLKLGADPNAVLGELQRSALHQAAHLNHVSCLTVLLRNGASMTVEDSEGDTPLHLAAWAGNCEALLAFLAHDVDVDWLSGRDGYSPLWCAISAHHIDAARLLLKHGARVSLRSISGGGLMPLHQAAVTGQSAMCELLLERGAQADSLDDDCNTPLHYAATSGSVASVRILLQHGADFAAVQSQGLTPAHWAAHKGHTEIVSLLYGYGANIDTQAEEGATPLHLAANRGHLQAARFLLEKGANPELEAAVWDGVNGTPSHIAQAKGHIGLAKVIESWPRKRS